MHNGLIICFKFTHAKNLDNLKLEQVIETPACKIESL